MSKFPMKPEVHIENWCIIDDKLHGEVHNHPRNPGPWKIISSPIIKRDFDNGIVETENTIYLLGVYEAPDLAEQDGR